MVRSIIVRRNCAGLIESNAKVTVAVIRTSSLDDNSWQVADVVLIGPQMRHLLGQISGKASYIRCR